MARARLLRCCGSPLGRQDDQAIIVSATLDEPSRHGVADRLPEVRTPKTYVTADVFSSPPRGRALDAEAVKLGDERRCALKTVSGDHRPMLPQLCGMCQQ